MDEIIQIIATNLYAMRRSDAIYILITDQSRFSSNVYRAEFLSIEDTRNSQI